MCARRDAGGAARRARAGARGAGRGRGVLRSTRPIGQGLARVQRVGEAWRGSGRRRRAHGWAARSAPEEEERKREERREEKEKKEKKIKRKGGVKREKEKGGRRRESRRRPRPGGHVRRSGGTRWKTRSEVHRVMGRGLVRVSATCRRKRFLGKKETELDDAQIILKPILARDLI